MAWVAVLTRLVGAMGCERQTRLSIATQLLAIPMVDPIAGPML